MTGIFVLISVALWGLIIYGLFRAIRYAVRRWPALDKDGRRKVMIAGAIALVLAGGLLIWKPWESQNYKDCLRAYQSTVDGSPNHRRADLEEYCHETTEGKFKRD